MDMLVPGFTDAPSVTATPKVTMDDVPPLTPARGDFWYDTSRGYLFIWYDDGNTLQWVVANPGRGGNEGPQGPPGIGANIAISDTAPANPSVGQLWWDSAFGKLFIWYQDADSRQWVPATPNSSSSLLPQGYVLADSYGATRNEVTFNLATADAKARGLNVMVGPGTWTTTPGGTFINPGVEVVGAGPALTHFVKVGDGNCFSSYGTAPNTSSGGALLTANAPPGALAVTVAGGQGVNYVDGDKCILISNDLLLASIASPNGEFCTVQRKVNNGSDTVGLWGTVKMGYTTANGARLIKVPLLQGVAYRNFSILMDETVVVQSTSSQNLHGIDLRWCQSPAIENVTISHFLKGGIMFVGCSGGRVDGCRMSDGASVTATTPIPPPIASSDGPAGFGYAVFELGINEGLVVDSTVNERVRHGYTTSMGNVAVFGYGYPFGTIISNSVSIDSKAAGWDTHIGPFGTKFVGCTSIGARNVAFQIRSRGSTVEGCSASNTFAAALWLRGGANGSGQTWGDECRVSGFTSTDSNYGIYDPVDFPLDWREQGAVVDDGDDNQIDGVTVVRSGGPILSVSTTTFWSRRGIYSNLVGHQICQLAATKKYAVAIDSGHTPTEPWTISIDGLTVHSTDGKVTHLVYRRINSTNVSLRNIVGYGHSGVSFYAPDSDLNVTFVNVQGVSYRDVVGPRLREDFTYGFSTTLGAWKALVGTNPQCIAATSLTAVGGLVRMTSGNSGGSVSGTTSMALDCSELCGNIAMWQASAGGLSAEFRVSLGSAGLVCVFVGFTANNTTLHIPFTIAPGNVLAATTTDAVGLVYDNAADTKEWTGVGVATSVLAGMTTTGTFPASAVMQRLRIDVSTTGVATFSINGVLKGTALTGAVTPTVNLVPIVAVLSRTTATKFVNVDAIYVEQNAV